MFIQTPPGVHCYVLFTYGYHVQDLVSHLLEPRSEITNDWNEMLLHHLAALALYPGFFFGNLMGAGTVLAWLHDLADIPVNLCRICLVCEFKIATVLFYLTMCAAWFYTRLLVLPYYIYMVLTMLRFPKPLEHFQPLVYFEVAFLSVMQFLHVFWFGLFIRMGLRLVRTGEQKDMINTIPSQAASKLAKGKTD